MIRSKPLFFVALSIALAAASSVAADVGRLRVGITTGLTSFDIQEVRDVVSSKVLGNVYDGLVAYSPATTRIEPSLAVSWTAANRFAEWTFKIRPNVVFSDGTPATPTEIANSLSHVSQLVGRAEMVPKDATGELLFRLKHPDADFPAQFAQGFWSVSLRKGKKLYGTGPFLVDPASTKTSITLRRNPRYWGRPAKTDEVEFKSYGAGNGALVKLREAMAAGEVDLTDLLPLWEVKRLEDNGAIQTKSITSRGLTMLGFNMKRKPFNDPRVREAVARAIDRSSAVVSLFGAGTEVARTIIPPSILGTKKDPWELDRARAKVLLAEAGYPHGFETTMIDAFSLGGGAAGRPLFSEQFARDLDEIGIRVKVTPVKSFEEFLSRMAKSEYELAISAWIADTGSPADWFESNFASFMKGTCPACNNTWQIENAELDRLIAEARARKSAEALASVVEIVYREIPFVPIVYGPQIGVWNRRVSGYSPSPTPTLAVRDVEIH